MQVIFLSLHGLACIVQANQATGTGTILDAMRLNCPLVVVPNPELMDNHQEELAETMASFEYLVHGSIE